MNGRTHLKLGITTAIATTICISKYTGNTDILLYGSLIAPVLSILTSQLADLDSTNSKISQKIPIVNWIKSDMFLLISLIISFITCIFLYKIDIGYKDIFEKCYQLSNMMFMLYAFIKIFFKHRKLTHCLIACVFITILSFYPYYRLGHIIFFVMGIGLSSGYCSHIFYDCLTTKGCPLLYPFIKKTLKGPLNSSKHGNIGMMISYILIAISVIYYLDLPSLISKIK